MAKSFPIRFQGDLWKGGTNEAIKNAAQRTAQYAQQRLTETSPKRTGRLSQGWKVRVKGNGLRIVNDVPYTGFVIRGTRRMRGNPFFQMAVSDAARVFKEELASELGKKFATRITSGISQRFDFNSLNGDNSPLRRM